MRRLIHALLVGSLAFGLVAAAASGATMGLVLEDVIRVGTGDARATVNVIERACEGAYEIFWEYAEDSVTILGFSAYRTPEDEPDEGLAFCAGRSFVLQLSDGMGGWIELDVSTSTLTDENGGILGARFSTLEGIQFEDGDEVRLVIGPEAATY
jgi:hypothetical protein